MFHRHQNTNFRVTEFSESGAFLHSLLKAKYTKINIGELFEYLADALWNTVGATTDRVNFSLINVCSPFTRFSHGSCIAPPLAAWPRGKSLIFTFAIRSTRTYQNRLFNKRHVRHNSNSLTKWGLNANCNEFISISVDMVDGEEWGTNSSRANELQYIYNLIGPMTKSLMRRQMMYETLNRDYDQAHELVSLHVLHSELYRMPLKQLFTSIPYHLWPFNYHIWEFAPNILPQRTITPSVAIYFFMYLNKSISKQARVAGDVTMKRLGLSVDKDGSTLNDSGICGILAESLLSFVQRMRSADGAELSDAQLLAPALLKQFLDTGSTQLPVDISYQMKMHMANNELLVDLRARDRDMSYLFMPPRLIAHLLINEDEDWRNTVNSALKFPPDDLHMSDQ